MVAGLGVALGMSAAAQQPVYTWSDEQKAEFLREAEVIGSKELGVGITNTLRLTLKHGDVEHDAHFQSIDVRKPVERTDKGLELQFADSYKFNIAAYRLDRMIGLKMIPVSIERRYGKNMGAFTWWVDGVLMMEKDRYLKKISPPDTEKWEQQMHRVRVFNELVYNTDANLGNVLITSTWQIKLIDFSRAFRPFPDFYKKKNLMKIDRKLLAAIRNLDEADVRSEMKDVLTSGEVESLLARRDLLVTFFDEQIRKKGEDKVLY